MQTTIFNEQEEIRKIVAKTKSDIEIAYNKLDFIQDEELIDSVIYEIKSLTKRYEYYIRLCKEKGVVASGFNKIS